VTLAGVTEIETRDGSTVRLKDPLTPLLLAETEHCPLAFAVSSPPGAMVAVFELDVLHVTELVRSCVLQLLYEPVAFNCSLCPAIRVGFCPDTCMEERFGADVLVEVLPPPQAMNKLKTVKTMSEGTMRCILTSVSL